MLRWRSITDLSDNSILLIYVILLWPSMASSTIEGSAVTHVKRSWTSDSEGDGGNEKKFCWATEPLSPECMTDSRTESTCSIQYGDTDSVKSTIYSNSSDESVFHVDIEFEPRSLTNSPNPFGSAIPSTSDSEAILYTDIVSLALEEANSSAGGLSCASSTEMDPEVPKADYWTCLQCKTKNNRPQFRYCERCYKIRKSLFPPRPKPRKKRKRKALEKESLDRGGSLSNFGTPIAEEFTAPYSLPTLPDTDEAEDKGSQSPGCIKLLDSQDSGLGVSHESISLSDHRDKSTQTVDSSQGLCLTCLERPRDAAFVHTRCVHIYCCYGCSVRVWRSTKKCPVCNRKVMNILKVY